MGGAERPRRDRWGKGWERRRLGIARPGQDELQAIVFFVKGELAKRADALAPGSRADLLAYLERDSFAKGQPVRLRLLDLRAV